MNMNSSSSNRSIKQYFFIGLKGMAMGAADVVPGVSGGTIAFISGIYQELVETISGFKLSLLKTLKQEGFKAAWEKGNFSFITALFIGILISVFSLMKLVHFLLENHPIKLWAFFFGLVLASILFIGKQIKQWNFKTIIAFLVSALLAFGITKLGTSGDSENLFYLFLSGAIASCAMILPGISGSFILVLLGAYGTITKAVHDFDLKRIIVVALGVIVGLLSFSHLLKWLFKHYENLTLAILTGFVLGSLNKIWPWKKTLESVFIDDKQIVLNEVSILPQDYPTDPQLLWALILSILGFGLILLLERLAKNK